MKAADCLAVRRALFEAGTAARAFDAHQDLASHVDGCADCRRWVRLFEDGAADDERATELGAAIARQTGTAACLRARDLVGASYDEPLADLDGLLVAQHLAACADCRDVAAEMAAAIATLPTLAVLDPGPWFTARVLAATSRRQAAARFADRWRQAWSSLAERPRFALEAAYVLTLVFVLVAGNPMGALERTAARVEPLARQHVAGGVEDAARALGAGLGVLKDRALGPAVQPASEMGLAARLIDRWNRTVAAALGGLSDLVATIQAAAEQVWSWAGRVFGFGPSSGEPTTPTERSPR